jgi:small GTP-binding protein
MRSGEGFIIVYSITSRQSFEEAKEKYQKLLLNQDKDHVPVVLCGNKCDLESERQVLKTEGHNLAKSWGVSFYECSAMERTNIDEIFFDLTRQVRVAKGEALQPQKKDKKHSKRECTIF